MQASINIPLAVALGVVITACGGGGATASTASTDVASTSIAGAASDTSTLTVPENGARLLAAQCFQCHGTDGNSVSSIDSLSGESEAELIEEMLEMQAEAEPDDIMHKHAMGYTDEQIRLIAAYIAAQPGNGSEGDDDDDGRDDDDYDDEGGERDDD